MLKHPSQRSCSPLTSGVVLDLSPVAWAMKTWAQSHSCSRQSCTLLSPAHLVSLVPPNSNVPGSIDLGGCHIQGAPASIFSSVSNQAKVLVIILEELFGEIRDPCGWRLGYPPPFQDTHEASLHLQAAQLWDCLGLQCACQRNNINARKDKR